MRVSESALAGVFRIELELHADSRGSFREVFHSARLSEVPGLDTFRPVQQNVATSRFGTIRGIHAEPWNKLIHVVHGAAFAAIVDLRPKSETFGDHLTFHLDEGVSLFVPAGLGNSYQALSEDVAYSYLVDDHWTSRGAYKAVAFDDPDLAIAWPILGGLEIVSDKDRGNPSLASLISP